MATGRRGFMRWPARLRELGDVHDRRADDRGERDRPRADAAPAAAARGDRRSRVRRGRHADRLRQRRRHPRLQRPSRSRRLRHQQGMEPRRRHHLFRHRGRRARRRAARHSRASACRCGRRAATTISRYAARAAAAIADAMLRQPLPPRTFLNINVPKGEPKGLSCHRAGEAESRDVGRGAARSERATRTTGSKKARTSGSRTIGRTIRRCATATCR